MVEEFFYKNFFIMVEEYFFVKFFHHGGRMLGKLFHHDGILYKLFLS
jgi:hypothetical protein